MKLRLATALAVGLAFIQVAPAAYAEQATQFRSVAPQSFSTEDLRRYGLSADEASQVHALQQQGYQVRVLSAEEAEQYRAGLSNRTWWIIGGVVLVAAIVAAS